MLLAIEEALEHTVEDSLFVIAAMFLTYLAMEYLEHRTGDKVQQLVQRAGRLGPVIGAVAGVVPQCGFSAAASNLYAGRVITMGTLIAIYLSTSDEMLPVMIASQASAETILWILLVKLLVGMAAGFVIDLMLTGKCGANQKHGQMKEQAQKSVHPSAHELDHASAYESNHPSVRESDYASAKESGHTSIHEICEQEHCDCEKGIFSSAVKHTVKVSVFLLLISFALNLVLELMGEDVLAGFLLDRPIVGPLVAGMVGFIPNCAASVVITELYLGGLISVGSMLAGLLVGAGVGLLVLFRVNHHRRENLKIAGILYLIGVLVGIIAEFLV